MSGFCGQITGRHQILVKQSESCVQVLGTKSSTFSGDVFVVCDLNHTVAPLLFVNDMVLLALTEGDLLYVMWGFAPDCEVAGMRVSIFKSEYGVR